MLKIKDSINIKIILILIITTTIINIINIKTFSTYLQTWGINYSGTTGEMICEYELEQDESYVDENDIPYIMVYVKNFRTESGSTILTDVNLSYSLTISNSSGNGIYKWEKVGTNDGSSSFTSSVTTSTYSMTTTQQTDTFKVYVKLSENQPDQDVTIDVYLNATQTNVNS